MNTRCCAKSRTLQNNPRALIEIRKILLIANDKWIRLFIESFAKQEGISLVILETAEQGLERLEEHEFDAVIVDNDLPGMSGLEFLIEIQGFHPHSSKVLITEPGEDALIAMAKKMGIQSFIEKPILEFPYTMFR